MSTIYKKHEAVEALPFWAEGQFIRACDVHVVECTENAGEWTVTT